MYSKCHDQMYSNTVSRLIWEVFDLRSCKLRPVAQVKVKDIVDGGIQRLASHGISTENFLHCLVT